MDNSILFLSAKKLIKKIFISVTVATFSFSAFASSIPETRILIRLEDATLIKYAYAKIDNSAYFVNGGCIFAQGSEQGTITKKEDGFFELKFPKVKSKIDESICFFIPGKSTTKTFSIQFKNRNPVYDFEYYDLLTIDFDDIKHCKGNVLIDSKGKTNDLTIKNAVSCL